MPARHLDIGRQGEDAAAAHLEAKGLAVLERNLRLGRLELDLVCADPAQADTLVFVEVKTRAEGSLGSPADGLTPAKRGRLIRAAQSYLSAHDAWSRPCRFDLVSVTFRNGRVAAVEHVEDAFRPEADTRRRSGSWQPW